MVFYGSLSILTQTDGQEWRGEDECQQDTMKMESTGFDN